MRAILMAAGIGSRISGSTKKPKSLLEIGGKTVLRHTVEMLQKNGVEIAIVVGYKRHDIYQELEGLNIKFYYNPFYKVTNSMASLWFARDFLRCDEDVILANADVFWEQKIYDRLMESDYKAVMLADKTRVQEGDFFFEVKDEMLINYGKDLNESHRTSEYVGIAKLRADFLPLFINRLKYMVDSEVYNLWWENVLYQYCKETPIKVLDTEGMFWSEIDVIEDYQRILNYINNKQKGGNMD